MPTRFKIPTVRLADFALLGVVVLGTLTVAEVLLRVLSPQTLTPAFIWPGREDAALFALDPRYGVVLKPNLDEIAQFGTHVRTNSRGLRDHEFGAKQSDEFRILSLGDSYAFGFGVEVEQSYTKVVEDRLNRELPGRTFSVVDAGVTGYGTKQQDMVLQDLLPVLKPDFVLATFTAGNDVYDNAVFEDQLRTGLQTPLGFVGRHSHLARLFLKASFPLWFFLENREAKRLQHTIRLLEELEAHLREAGLPYLMLVIPARHQIRPSVEPAARLLMSVGLESLVFRQNQWVIRHFRQQQVPYLDLWPPLVKQDSVAQVSFVEDSHLNALGHQVVAREIVAHLRRVLGSPPSVEHLRGKSDGSVP